MKGPVRLVGWKHKEGVGEGWLRVAQRPRMGVGGEPGPQAWWGGRERLGRGGAHGYGYNEDSVRRRGGEPGPQARVKGTKRKGEGDGTGGKKREKRKKKKKFVFLRC